MGYAIGNKGSGAERTLILFGHSGATPAIIKKLPTACMVNFTYPGFKGHYKLLRHGGSLPDLQDLLPWVFQQAGPFVLQNLILVGFSEGCQLVRAYLAAGEVPSGIVCIDGVHASSPPDEKTQIQPFRAFFDRCKLGDGHWGAITASSIPTTGYEPTSKVLPLVTGEPAWLPTTDDAGTVYKFWETGGLVAEQWPGGNAQAHIHQGQVVLPRLVSFVGHQLNLAPVAPVIQTRPPGGGGGRPPPVPVPPVPVPPVPPVPPAPPPPAPPSSGGGEGIGAAVTGMGLLFLLSRGARRRGR